MKRPIILFILAIGSMQLTHTANQVNPNDLAATLATHAPEIFEAQQPLRKVKGYLEVDYLNVKRALTVNGNQIVNNGGSSSLASYGQLIISSDQPMYMNTLASDSDWMTLPLNAVGVSSNMAIIPTEHTDYTVTQTGSITVQQDGIYQINTSVYFAAENSDEDSFTHTTYMLGLDVNGTTTPLTAVYAEQASEYSLSANTLMQLSANDEIHFFFNSSSGVSMFANYVTFKGGNAYLVQISN